METATKETTEKIIARLNDLVEINNDRIQGYERAIAENEDEELDYLFVTMASHSKTNKSDLGHEITLLGGTPTDGTKTSGKLFRLWMDLKAAMTGKNKAEILASCEFGEDAAIETYETILKNEDKVLNSQLISLIESQKAEIVKDHDRIKVLREKEKN
ncbi:hypothetical protein CNR22_14265 [Sphingobacteriaceae bacterium]|nr:hypothetical protein CNR22_14265 [Sphingobacteriaceae bacterium]